MATASSQNPIATNPATRGPKHHFFGYYDKSPWDFSQRWMLGLETSFMDRQPTEIDRAVVGLIDTENAYAWIPIAETKAWNWQQGCMLQWLNGGRQNEVIFNDRRDGQFVSRILNTKTREERTIETPIYAVSRDGTRAVSLNFSRLHKQRPGYGYAGVPDRWEAIQAPEQDGLFAIDIATGRSRLLLSIAEAAAFQAKPEFDGKFHRFNHLQFDASGDRFACLHRYKTPAEGVGTTRLLTLNYDGTGLRCLSDHDLVSHYDWNGSGAILAWARRRGVGDRYFLFPDGDGAIETVGEGVLLSDGHCSYSPDASWMLTDTYPDSTSHRTLSLYHLAQRRRVDIGRFHEPPENWENRPIRCDLHPRWSPDGRQVCIDSVHEGSRQMYVLDVSTIVTTG